MNHLTLEDNSIQKCVVYLLSLHCDQLVYYNQFSLQARDSDAMQFSLLWRCG